VTSRRPIRLRHSAPAVALAMRQKQQRPARRGSLSLWTSSEVPSRRSRHIRFLRSSERIHVRGVGPARGGAWGGLAGARGTVRGPMPAESPVIPGNRIQPETALASADAEIADDCHAEGRGFESHQPLRCDVSGHRSQVSRDIGLSSGSPASGRALCHGCASRSWSARSGGWRGPRRSQARRP
jgi:hypothetical protein